MDYKIAIVNSSSFGTRFPDQMERLQKIGTVERVRVAGDAHGAELVEALKDYNIIISSVTPFFDAEFFEHKTDLLLLSRHGIGYNNVDVKACNATGCILTTVSPLVERDAVAEGAVALLLDAMRQVSDSHVAANEGRWAERAKFVGNGVSGKTLGIIGCGNIGPASSRSSPAATTSRSSPAIPSSTRIGPRGCAPRVWTSPTPTWTPWSRPATSSR